jgi:hypothetical protein
LRRLACALAAVAVALGCGHLPRVDPRPAPIGERMAAFAQAPVPAARLLFVSVAGLDASAWQAPDAMPTLAALAGAGVVADRVGTIAPASAYPVHATLVTGRSPGRHGVPADRRIGRHGVRSERYWHASQLHGASLWQLAAEKRVPIAALDWPVTVGAEVDALLPDLTPVRRGERYADLLAGSATPALAAAVRDAGEEGEAAAPAGPVRDRLLVDLACRTAVAARPPALLLLRLTQTEPALRDAGPGSAEARAAFAAADAELARLLGCFDEVGLLADAAVAVVGDRVFEPVHSVVLPNVALADARLVDLEPTGGVQSWLALARSNGGSAFVYARDEGRAVEAREVLEGLARRSGAFRVVPASEMATRGADPDAWFGLDAAAGFSFGDESRGPLVGAAPARGASGRLRPDATATPAFVAFGRGFRRGVRVPEMSQLDVAPTLAAALGLALPGAEGRALVGLLVGAAPVLGR